MRLILALLLVCLAAFALAVPQGFSGPGVRDERESLSGPDAVGLDKEYIRGHGAAGDRGSSHGTQPKPEIEKSKGTYAVRTG